MIMPILSAGNNIFDLHANSAAQLFAAPRPASFSAPRLAPLPADTVSFSGTTMSSPLDRIKNDPKRKNPTYVVGHKNPDADSVLSAIAYAYLKTQLELKKPLEQRLNYQPAAAGELPPDAKFALEYFGVKFPKVMNNFESTVSDIYKPVLRNDALRKLKLTTYRLRTSPNVKKAKTGSDKLYNISKAEPCFLDDTPTSLVIKMMEASKGSKSAPIVDKAGALVGIVSGKDLLKLLYSEPKEAIFHNG